LWGFDLRGAALNHGRSGHIMFGTNSAVHVHSWTSESPVETFFQDVGVNTFRKMPDEP
jgi:hypothetical protein